MGSSHDMDASSSHEHDSDDNALHGSESDCTTSSDEMVHDSSEEESPEDSLEMAPTTGEIHPSVSTGDLGQVVELQSIRKLNDNEKYFLLKNHFVPTKGYKFPCHVHGNQTRQFQMKWLEKYNGLTYSES